MRTLTVVSGPTVLGSLLTETHDQGVVTGRFIPAADYSKVQHIFRAYVAALPSTSAGPTDEAMLANCRSRMEELHLGLLNEDGARIRTGWIQVNDFSAETGEEELFVEAFIEDQEFWRTVRSTTKL